jgi:hypothetical protein
VSGIGIIRAIQSIHTPALDAFFLLMSDLHSERFYLLVIPLVLWFVDKRLARYLTAIFILGTWANDLLKDLFHTQRPSPEAVRVLRPEYSYAFPSGHAMGPISFWGAVALAARRRWVTAAVVAVVFLIGLSRLYIGVHWPLDVLGGWAIGALMLWGFAASRRYWQGEGMRTGAQIAGVLVIAAGALGITAFLGLLPSMDTPAALAGDAFVLTGTYVGFFVGAALEEALVGFDPRRGGPWLQTAKLFLGALLLLGVKEGFKLLLPATALGDLIRYFCVGLTATLVAPWLFRYLTPGAPADRRLTR